jgi:hypothetical protein
MVITTSGGENGLMNSDVIWLHIPSYRRYQCYTAKRSWPPVVAHSIVTKETAIMVVTD